MTTKRFFVLLATIVLSIFLNSCGKGKVSVDEKVVAVKGQIAFSSDRGGCLFLLKNSKIERLTLEGGSGRFSTDGKKIYFRKGLELFVYDLDTNITSSLKGLNKYKPFDFDLSPDNKKIVFVSGGQKFDYAIPDNIYIANLDGTEYQQLTYFTRGPKGWNAAGAARPRWSPDGKMIVFSGPNIINKSGDSDAIYTIKPDRSDLKKIIGTDGDFLFAREPTWSPDSRKIAFVGNLKNDKQRYNHLITSKIDGSDKKIWTIGYDYVFIANADGSEIKQVTTKQYNDMAPVFSPDGTQLCFASRRHYASDKKPNPIGSELFVINIDGTNEIRVTSSYLAPEHNIISPHLSKNPSDSDPDWHN